MNIRTSLGLAVLALGIPGEAGAQDRRDEQFYYPGSFNWSFLKVYPEAARLFNAFDYGHAVLYERLLTRPATEREAALEKEYQFLTTDLLIRPPKFAVAEEVIEPAYAKLAWQAKQMFDWTHVLHRQIYDIYADERLSIEAKDALIENVTDYYLARNDVAFTPVPKSMALMDEQYFSQVFRERHPKFNGLIWAYHWLQVGLYEPLIAGTTPSEKKAGVKATLARFWSMLEDAPSRFPKMMPMTATIAPTFSAQHPRAAVIFDNLHMMHDIISDVLAADTVPKSRKRAVIYQQLAEFRDGTRNVMTMDEWRNMGEMMGGIGAMGGPATGLLAPASTAAGLDHAAMGHGTPARDSAAPQAPMPPGMSHAAPAGDTAAEKMPAGHAMPIPGTPRKPDPAPAAGDDMSNMPGHEMSRMKDPATPVRKPVATTAAHEHADTGEPADSAAVKPAMDSAAAVSSGIFPMHSWHPFIVHLPLVALFLAVLFDTVAAWRTAPRWRDAATILWWIGLAGTVAAVVTGLLAYNRVDHSDRAHEIMTLHRNLAFVSSAILLVTAAWRWRRPFSRAAAVLGVVGAAGLAGVGYLGGDLVYRYAVGIPTAVLRQVSDERVGFDEDEMRPGATSDDTLTAGSRQDSSRAATKPHTHAPGKEHDD
jgi:uncharacterized membrane protein